MNAQRNVETVTMITIGVMGTDGCREEMKVQQGKTAVELKEEGSVAFVNGTTVADNYVMQPGDELVCVHPSAKAWMKLHRMWDCVC
jgi:hypothetical protein